MGLLPVVCAIPLRVSRATTFVLLAASLCMARPIVTAGGESPYLTVDGSAWRLATGDVDGDGRDELIYATFQGAVGCLDLPDGRARRSPTSSPVEGRRKGRFVRWLMDD